MKCGGKRELAKPRDFQRDPFIIFGEPLAKGCFRNGVGVGDGVVGVGARCDIFILVFVGGGSVLGIVGCGDVIVVVGFIFVGGVGVVGRANEVGNSIWCCICR